ncbi:U-box domain-containing protein 38 [Nymphaea thermarum]|nr:U-box domain-containing protein 38 [Nymphaea thermarum]
MKSRWRISFHTRQPRRREPPQEFLCPISNSLMADPVILPSGHSFERRCIEAALSLPYQHYDLPFLCGTTTTTAGTLIPNVALKTAIANWCLDSGLLPPAPPDTETARRLACKLLASASPENASNVQTPAAQLSSASGTNARLQHGDQPDSVSDAFSETTVQLSLFDSPDSVLTPSNLDSRDAFKSSNRFHSSDFEASPPRFVNSSDFEASPPRFVNSSVPVSFSSESDSEADELIKKMRSPTLSDQEEAVIWIRNLTREDREARERMCSRELLTCLRALMRSRCAGVQVNAVAALVNLSLEEPNKVVIVRSGLVPSLIDVLKGGHVEAREYAVGAIFSLALDDGNKTALGVLGAVRPLVHQLGSSCRSQARLEATMALYHLSFARGNHVKLIRASAAPKLIALAREDKPKIGSRAMRVLCNVATSSEGRAAMLDSGALSLIVGLVAESWQWEKDGRRAELIREHGLMVLCLLARDRWRFKGLAREAGAEKVMAEVVGRGSGRAKEWATKLLMVMKSSAASASSNLAGCGHSSFVDEPVAPSWLHERIVRSERNRIY